MEQAEVDRLILKPTSRRRLGKYVLLGRLGHGGMGKIYLAFLPGPAGIEKLVVIKRLHSHLTSDRALVTSFLDEARLSMALSHPNIVHTYDVGEIDGRYFMAMEYIDGQNLGVLLRTAKRSGAYPSSQLWGGLFLGVLDGLHAAHTAKDARGRPLSIIHRDVSPQNVLVTYDGAVKLVDFGIAKAAMRVNETDAGVLKGKYAYMSPEQCESTELDPRSDVFSAGVVFWEMLAGRRLYKSDSILKSVERILGEPPISPLKVNAECDPALAAVVVKALQKKRADRFASAEEFRDAVDDALRKSTQHFKKSDIRELMQRVFADVISRQRAVLDACLAGSAVVEDDDEGPATGGVRTRGSDSASDVGVAPLKLGGESEPTTPSAFRVSPLVTRDGEAETARPIVAEKRLPTHADDRGSSAPDAVTSASHVLGAVEPAPPRTHDDRRFVLPFAMLLGFVLVGALAALLYATGALDDVLGIAPDVPLAAATPPTRAPREREPPQGERTRTEPDDGARRVGATTDRNPLRDDEQVDDGAAMNGSRVDEKPAVGKTTDDVRGKKGQGGKQKARGGRDDERPTSKGDGRPPPKPATDDKKPAVEEKAPPVDEKPAPPPTIVEETGFVTLDTVPWTVVSLNGRVLGNTPLIQVKVPAGELTLRLKNEAEGIDQEYIVVVRPGQTTRKKLGLD